MDVLPAIDLRDGKVVRLARGDYDAQTLYSDDPAAVAAEFATAGARWIHIVDLDAAKTGKPTNTSSVLDIRRSVDVHIQQGGGARDEATIRKILADGVDRVVVGSAALENWAWFEQLLQRSDLARHLALGLDARGGKLAIHGWLDQLDATPLELARRVTGSELGAIVYTDIARDGMLSGVNAEATAELVSATDVPIIASGGVSSIEDIRRCRRIGCQGVIIGRAYYEGKIDLAEAIAEANKNSI
ncbi:MAG: 1-(5-phosphoribosyl)-5-[(5-phosphoribosylamino)methylideneamino]imidazole-4-carboxamide isomerase [Planctomycetota bacterium]|jgi:phosphoribosylformimino-5-aminoimidazole carboxamide ribotide isomerase